MWVWINSTRWWRTGKPGMLQSTGLQRVRRDLATEQQGELKFNQYFLVVIWAQGQRSQIDALQDADSRFKRWDSVWQSRFLDSLGKSAALALLGLNSYTALSWGREATWPRHIEHGLSNSLPVFLVPSRLHSLIHIIHLIFLSISTSNPLSTQAKLQRHLFHNYLLNGLAFLASQVAQW